MSFSFRASRRWFWSRGDLQAQEFANLVERFHRQAAFVIHELGQDGLVDSRLPPQFVAADFGGFDQVP